MTTTKNARARRSWYAIIRRCTDPSTIGYDRYGGRGIRVCNRWRESFEAFLTDMGPCPSSRHTLDRIDNDGNYEPGNCRWATMRQQILNKSPHILSLNAFALDEEDRDLLAEATRLIVSNSAVSTVRFALRFLLKHYPTVTRLMSVERALTSIGDMADRVLQSVDRDMARIKDKAGGILDMLAADDEPAPANETDDTTDEEAV
jgi:hypothetical protein